MEEAERTPELKANIEKAKRSSWPYILVGGFHSDKWMYCSNAPYTNWTYSYHSGEPPDMKRETDVYMGVLEDYKQIYLCGSTIIGNTGKDVAASCQEHLLNAGYRMVVWYPLKADIGVAIDSCLLCVGVKELGNWQSSWMTIKRTGISFMTSPYMYYYYGAYRGQHHFAVPLCNQVGAHQDRKRLRHFR